MSTPAEEVTVDLDATQGAEVGERSQIAPDGTRVGAADVKIEVETATEPEKSPKKVPAPVVTPDEGLEKLKKQLETEREGRIAAENRAREASEAEARAKTESQGTQLDLAKGAIASLTKETDALEEKYANALAASDFAGAAKVQREMSANEAKLVELNRGKTAMEKAPKVVPRAPDDPVERLAAQLSPNSAAWVRSHSEYARDPVKYRKMIRAHEDALDDGFTADTPDYFAAIEQRLGVTQPRIETSHEEPTTAAAQPSTSRPSRQTAPPSAPVSRSGNGTGSSYAKNAVPLTADMQEMARLLFPDSKTPYEDYARNMTEEERDKARRSRH